jgi:hypothetical protein
LPFAPSLNRLFTAGDTVGVYFQARRAPESTPVSGTVVLVDGAGREDVLASWRLDPGHAAVTLRVRLPAVAPAGYRLVVRANHGAHQATAGIGIQIQ